MSENKFSRIQLRRGTKEGLKLVNPMLREGEPLSEIDTGRLKIGDGINRYNKLKYVGGGGSSGAPSIISFIVKRATTDTGEVYTSSLVPNGCIITNLVLSYTVSSSSDNIKITSPGNEYYNENYPGELSKEINIGNLFIAEDTTFTLTLIADETVISNILILKFSPYYYYTTSELTKLPFLGNTINNSNLDGDEYSKKLIQSRSLTANNINCGPNKYIYFILPTTYFNQSEYVSFTDIGNNFTGGFELQLPEQNATQIINEYGYSDTFNIYRSFNHSLGTKSFRIS